MNFYFKLWTLTTQGWAHNTLLITSLWRRPRLHNKSRKQEPQTNTLCVWVDIMAYIAGRPLLKDDSLLKSESLLLHFFGLTYLIHLKMIQTHSIILWSMFTYSKPQSLHWLWFSLNWFSKFQWICLETQSQGWRKDELIVTHLFILFAIRPDDRAEKQN